MSSSEDFKKATEKLNEKINEKFNELPKCPKCGNVNCTCGMEERQRLIYINNGKTR